MEETKTTESIKIVQHTKFCPELTQQQSANAELQAWKESEIKTTLPLFEMMHSHPEMKIGDSCIQKSIQFIHERDELKKQKEELVEAFNRIKAILESKSFGENSFSWYSEQIRTIIANTPPKN